MLNLVQSISAYFTRLSTTVFFSFYCSITEKRFNLVKLHIFETGMPNLLSDCTVFHQRQFLVLGIACIIVGAGHCTLSVNTKITWRKLRYDMFFWAIFVLHALTILCFVLHCSFVLSCNSTLDMCDWAVKCFGLTCSFCEAIYAGDQRGYFQFLYIVTGTCVYVLVQHSLLVHCVQKHMHHECKE